jgi:hypothetical protein
MFLAIFKTNNLIKYILSICLITICLGYVCLYSIQAYACSNQVSNTCININAIASGCLPNISIPVGAEYTQIDATQCARFKQYTTSKDLQSSATKYSYGKLQLNEYIIGGLISAESSFGIGTGGCDGYGDNGYGHGLVQVDSRSFTNLPVGGGRGIKVKVTTKKYGIEDFAWDNCKSSIQLAGAILASKSDAIDKTWTNIIKSAGVNISTNDDGSFKDPVATELFRAGVIMAYNAGQGGVLKCSINSNKKVVDTCTTNNNYLDKVLIKANEFFECLNNRKPNAKEVSDVKTNKQDTAQLQECITKISTANTASNVPSNYNFTNELKQFILKTSGKRVDSPVPGEQYPELNGQCVSLVKAYQASIGAATGAWDAIYPVEKWQEFANGNTAGFQDNSKYQVVRITDFNKLEVGDIIISDHSSAVSSHTGVFIRKNETNWTMYDQNVNSRGQIAGESSYPKKDFVGALRYIKKIIL